MVSDTPGPAATGSAPTTSGLGAALQERFPGLGVNVDEAGTVTVEVSADRYLDLCRWLRDEKGFNYLQSLTAVDFPPEHLRVTLHLLAWELAAGVPDYAVLDADTGQPLSGERGPGGAAVVHVATRGQVVVMCRLPRGGPTIASVTHLWPTANWQERETFDLLGVNFAGHPDLRRVLLDNAFVGHPLQKDFVDQRPPRPRLAREESGR